MPQSGETSKRSTGSRGMELLTLYSVESPANHTHLQEKGKGNLTTVIFGPILSGLLAKWDPNSCWWRTSQVSLFPNEDVGGRELLSTKMGKEQLGGGRNLNRQPSDAYVESWPKSGMTRNGCLYRLRQYRPRIKGGECGSSLTRRIWPTPTTDDAHNIKGRDKQGEYTSLTRDVRATTYPTPRASEWKGTGPPGSKSQKYRRVGMKESLNLKKQNTEEKDLWLRGMDGFHKWRLSLWCAWHNFWQEFNVRY